MAVILKGEPVAQAIDRRTVDAVRALRAAPTLAILRVGQRADDMSYEKAAMKRCLRSYLAPPSAVMVPLLSTTTASPIATMP